MRAFDAPKPTAAFLWQASFILVISALVASLAPMLLGSISTMLMALGVPIILFLLWALLARPDIGLLVLVVLRSSTDAALVLGKGEVGGLHGTLAALSSPNAALILTLVLGGGFFIITHGTPFLSLPGGLLLTLLTLTGLIGILASDSKLLAINEWLPFVGILVVYALSAYCARSPKWTQRVVDAMAVSFILPALFGFNQLIAHSPTLVTAGGEPAYRILGTFVHPNPFGVYLVIVVSVFACQAFAHSGMRRALALLIVASAMVLLGATLARLAWAGVLVAFLVIGLLRYRGMLVAMAIVVVTAMVAVPTIATRTADPLESASFVDRVGIWNILINSWVDDTANESSFVTGLNRLAGLGPGTSQVALDQSLGFRQVAHDDYIRVLHDFGILGLLLYLVLAFALIRLAYRTARRTTDGVMAAVALSFLALTIAYPIMSITGNILGYTSNQIYFWTLAGLTAGIAKGQDSVRKAASPVTPHV